jgi:signal transduction histidine kinase
MGVALLLFFFVSRKKIITNELEKKSLEITHQKKLIQSIIVTQEKERTRIARDLHDDISSKINVIRLNANLLKEGNLNSNESVIVNESILIATQKTLESARKIAHDLLPPILEKFGLKDAIEELTDSFNNSRKITINYEIEYTKGTLSSAKELHFFRIVQELINNSVRHGNAKNCNIILQEKGGNIAFEYKDDGVGFNSEEISLKKGIGLKNIESRVALLKGNFLIESKLNDIDNKTSNLNFTKIVKKFNSFMNSNVILFNKRNNDITKKIINFNKEFQKLLKSIEKRDLKLMKKNIKNFSHLFNGYNGVPSNYIVGYKK